MRQILMSVLEYTERIVFEQGDRKGRQAKKDGTDG